MSVTVPTADELTATNDALTALITRVEKLEGLPAPVPVPPPPPPAGTIMGRDAIPTGAGPANFPDAGWGFDWCLVEHPIFTQVQPNDANGANLSAVPDPAGGPRRALRLHITFVPSGRAQVGWLGIARRDFNDQAKSAAGINVAWDLFIPVKLTAANDPGPWCNLQDWHSLDANQGNRQNAAGMLLAQDGSMRFRYEHGSLYDANGGTAGISPWSAIALPVGRWFTIERDFHSSANRDVTLNTWIDSALALSQSGVQTAAASNIGGNVEAYFKLYGSNNSQPAGTNWGQKPWIPDPVDMLIRNVRYGRGRLT